MKILLYSDLHLEFGHGWKLPDESGGDLLVLAGDIINFQNFVPLIEFLSHWSKPVLYVPGNHEYYGPSPMDAAACEFEGWLQGNLPQVTLLNNSSTSIGGVHFFGGTMWTDFNGGDVAALDFTRANSNDFKHINLTEQRTFTPEDSLELHRKFLDLLGQWLEL